MFLKKAPCPPSTLQPEANALEYSIGYGYDTGTVPCLLTIRLTRLPKHVVPGDLK